MTKNIQLPLPPHQLCAALSGLLCGALYYRTLAPTAMWYDMAEMPTAAYYLGIAHGTGYPLYLLLGKLFTLIPLGDIAYRVSLMSAFFATMTVIVVFFIVWDLTQHRIAATLAALTLGVSSTLWANATLPESHTLNAFFTALLTFLLFRWQRSGKNYFLFLSFFIIGLAMGNHHLIQFFGIATFFYWIITDWKKRRHLCLQKLPLLALLFLVGFAINLYLPIRAAQKPTIMWADATQWSVFLRMITTGQGSQTASHLLVRNPTVLWDRLQRLILFPPYELAFIGLTLSLLGGIYIWRKNRVLFIYSIIGNGFTLLFILFYGIHDIFHYFLPVYVMAAIWLGVGTHALLELLGQWQGRARMSGSYHTLIGVVLFLANLALFGLPLYLVQRDLPVMDRSQDDSSYLCTNYLSGRLPQDARVLTDFWAWAPLVYYQTLEGWRSDVWIYGALSSLDIEWEQFIPSLKAESDAIYVASGGPIPPGLRHQAVLHPVGLGVIETVDDYGIPQPKHKDIWAPLGNVYRIVERPPELGVHSVPISRRIDETRFGDSLSLVGFGGTTHPESIGSTPKLSYYWTLRRPTNIDYYVKVYLVDSSGVVQRLRGVPIWDHSHTIGGLTPTSTWKVGEIMGERYDTLIPWRVDPGRYAITAWVYEDREGTRGVAAGDRSSEADGVTLGYLEVLPRSGPRDVKLQNTPRE